MNGRTPTKGERLYIEACLREVGCVACRLDGREIENPEIWTEFHHDPDFGSNDKGAHYRGFGLCAVHHRGAFPPGCNPDPEIAVRHPALSTLRKFSDVYGPDEFLCLCAWEAIPESTKEAIGFDLTYDEIPD